MSSLLSHVPARTPQGPSSVQVGTIHLSCALPNAAPPRSVAVPLLQRCYCPCSIRGRANISVLDAKLQNEPAASLWRAMATQACGSPIHDPNRSNSLVWKLYEDRDDGNVTEQHAYDASPPGCHRSQSSLRGPPSPSFDICQYSLLSNKAARPQRFINGSVSDRPVRKSTSAHILGRPLCS